MSLFRLSAVLLLCAVVAACSSTRSSSRVDYKKAVTTAPLDVPPPLVLPPMGPDGLEVPTSPADETAVLPQPGNVRVERDGEVRWLVVDATPEQLWPRMHEFWKQQGFAVQQENPRVGVLETEWGENRADIPESFLRGLISKVAPNVYSAHTRDKYRLRLERGAAAGTTEIYLSHYGVEQVNNEEDRVVWQPRPSDAELVAEMMGRLMQYLGVAPERAQAVLAVQKAEQPPRAQLAGDHLAVDEGFARTWRLAGIALDRIGLVVEDLDRAKGVYYVRRGEAFALPEKEKQGWFSGWFSSEKQEDPRFRVLVQGDDNATRIAVQNDQGEPAPAEQATLVLTRLQEQLR